MVGGSEEGKLGQSLKKPLRSPSKLRRARAWAQATEEEEEESFWNIQTMPYREQTKSSLWSKSKFKGPLGTFTAINNEVNILSTCVLIPIGCLPSASPGFKYRLDLQVI